MELARCSKVSMSVAILLVILGIVSLTAMIGTVVTVLHDGRHELPPEPSEEPWKAGNLPSVPYALIKDRVP
jgi:hypothetical protein